jgi:hypothetical protein
MSTNFSFFTAFFLYLRIKAIERHLSKSNYALASKLVQDTLSHLNTCPTDISPLSLHAIIDILELFELHLFCSAVGTGSHQVQAILDILAHEQWRNDEERWSKVLGKRMITGADIGTLHTLPISVVEHIAINWLQ